MYDKDLINKVCNLSCLKNDVCRNQTTINYDTDYPFKKYYDVNIIIGAINKYLTKEWDDETLAGWCCIYCWILSGGFSKNLKEDLNPLEDFYKEIITWDLDGLSFFDEKYDLEYNPRYLQERIEQIKTLDYVWQTRTQWKGVYSPISTYHQENGEQCVLLINETKKEYIIFASEQLYNDYNHQNEYLKFISKNKFVKLVEKLKEKNYSLLSYAEDYYY